MLGSVLEAIDMKAGKTFHQFHAAALGEPYELVSRLFNESSFGFGILDKQFRYRAVNRALAVMNNLSPQAHLGKSTRDVIGGIAAMLEAPFRHVFSSGREVSFEFWAKSPKSNEASYWILNYFPIKDGADRVKLVGGVVVEVTHQKKNQQLFSSVTDELIRNLHLTPHDSNTLLQRIVDDCHGKTPVFNSKQHGSVSTGSSKPDFSGNEESTKSSPAILTPREREVMKFIAEGKTNKETGEILGISRKTVETHRARIRLKLDLPSTPALVYYAISNKILDPENMDKTR
jgi:DNA-binding CsgD family transcriptional regulator